ncbi:hypothetical protein B0T14DRAFT_259082 [Immersiella caudata]|uniref:Uncharacterized protein n=1 Tax=Immersiella caudata TaxID=314043 RepID=A0AA39WKP0_9PEZI|nr:hypothetical protein B0T14DRAFT_259082 [Immersiella caudata]
MLKHFGFPLPPGLASAASCVRLPPFSQSKRAQGNSYRRQTSSDDSSPTPPIPNTLRDHNGLLDTRATTDDGSAFSSAGAASRSRGSIHAP